MKPLELESPDVLAAGRVYEKAFREARHDTGVLAEKFLVLELEKDTRVTEYLSSKLPTIQCLKIAC